MSQTPDPCLRFDRMGETVAEVEQRALAIEVERIDGNDPGLGADAMGDGIEPRVAVACDQRRAIRLAPLEKGRIVDQSIFDDFGIARAELALVERVEQRWIGHDQGGHVEIANEIFLPCCVDRGLTPDSAVSLRQ